MWVRKFYRAENVPVTLVVDHTATIEYAYFGSLSGIPDALQRLLSISPVDAARG